MKSDQSTLRIESVQRTDSFTRLGSMSGSLSEKQSKHKKKKRLCSCSVIFDLNAR